MPRKSISRRPEGESEVNRRTVSIKTLPPRAITVAGSDSGGGAGIQADLKTFASLGVHGSCAITAITSQNTREVTDIFGIPPASVVSQIDAVHSDIGFDALKTGMLYSADTIRAISKYLRGHPLDNVVVDPVMISKSGARLLRSDAVDALVEDLLPLAHVVTPNAEEAQAICGARERISDVVRARNAARRIAKLGPKVVVVKGGHLSPQENDGEVVDVVYFKEEGRVEYLRAPRCNTRNTHGTGCVFASAIAAELAKGRDIKHALERAKIFVTEAIKNSLPLGRGSGPVNPTGEVFLLSQKFLVHSNVREALDILESNDALISPLIPESRSNIAMGIEGAKNYEDIAAIPGRITSLSKDRIAAYSSPEFGASRHIANAILAAMSFDGRMRAAMNIKYTEELVRASQEMGLTVSSYDRRLEPANIKRREGSSTLWGAKQAISKSRKKFPDLIYHKGDFGKEPMIVLLGEDAMSVARLAVKLSSAVQGQKQAA